MYTNENLFYFDADQPAPAGNANISTTLVRPHATVPCMYLADGMGDFLSICAVSFHFVSRSQLLLDVWTVMILPTYRITSFTSFIMLLAY